MRHVLFVCVHNAGRSQMAMALFNKLAIERGLAARAMSAGTEPADKVHDIVVDVMREWGVDLANVQPGPLTNDMVEQADDVITMGCDIDNAACPAVFLKGVEDWQLPDPKGREIEEVRMIRDEIQRRVDLLLTELADRA